MPGRAPTQLTHIRFRMLALKAYPGKKDRNPAMTGPRAAWLCNDEVVSRLLLYRRSSPFGRGTEQGRGHALYRNSTVARGGCLDGLPACSQEPGKRDNRANELRTVVRLTNIGSDQTIAGLPWISFCFQGNDLLAERFVSNSQLLIAPPLETGKVLF